jgi:AcrR family transcriptional regulator
MDHSPHADPATAPSSLRERKKQLTRQRIVEAAETLFARHGFDAVTVSQVARAAEVSEPTVYNYFETKEALVLDETDVFEERLRAMVRDCPQTTPLLDAVRAEAVAFIAQIVGRPDSSNYRGSMPYLVATYPPIRRHWLAVLERFTAIIAAGLVARSRDRLPLPTAKVLGGSIISVFAVVIDEVGQAMVDQVPLPARLRTLRRQVERAIDQMAKGFI